MLMRRFFCLLNGGINKLRVCVELSSFLNPAFASECERMKEIIDLVLLWCSVLMIKIARWPRLRQKLNLQIFSILLRTSLNFNHFKNSLLTHNKIVWVSRGVTFRSYHRLAFFLLSAEKGNWGEHINLQHVIETGDKNHDYIMKMHRNLLAHVHIGQMQINI